MNRTYLVKYKGVRIRPFKANGMYRGNGSIEFGEDGIHISGRHVFALGPLSGIALAIIFGWSYVTKSKIGEEVLFISPIMILLTDFVLLKRENIVVSYPDIINYLERRKDGLVAIDFKGPKWCAPVVLKSARWTEIIAALREIIPERDVSLTIFPPSSAPAAICWSALAFVPIYLLLFFATYLVIISPSAPSMNETKNENPRMWAWLVTFGMPLVISIFFAITTYKGKRRPTRADGLEIPAAALP